MTNNNNTIITATTCIIIQTIITAITGTVARLLGSGGQSFAQSIRDSQTGDGQRHRTIGSSFSYLFVIFYYHYYSAVLW